MPAPVAHKAKLTALYATISATLTKIPGFKSLEIDPGESETFENIDLENTYRAPVGSGTIGEGSIKGQLIYDPLGAEHQFLANVKSAGTEVVGKAVLSASGQEVSCKYLVTKFVMKAEVGGGLMVDFEAKLTEQFNFPTADPS